MSDKSKETYNGIFLGETRWEKTGSAGTSNSQSLGIHNSVQCTKRSAKHQEHTASSKKFPFHGMRYASDRHEQSGQTWSMCKHNTVVHSPCTLSSPSPGGSSSPCTWASQRKTSHLNHQVTPARVHRYIDCCPQPHLWAMECSRTFQNRFESIHNVLKSFETFGKRVKPC